MKRREEEKGGGGESRDEGGGGEGRRGQDSHEIRVICQTSWRNTQCSIQNNTNCNTKNKK